MVMAVALALYGGGSNGGGGGERGPPGKPVPNVAGGWPWDRWSSAEGRYGSWYRGHRHAAGLVGQPGRPEGENVAISVENTAPADGFGPGRARVSSAACIPRASAPGNDGPARVRRRQRGRDAGAVRQRRGGGPGRRAARRPGPGRDDELPGRGLRGDQEVGRGASAHARRVLPGWNRASGSRTSAAPPRSRPWWTCRPCSARPGNRGGHGPGQLPVSTGPVGSVDKIRLQRWSTQRRVPRVRKFEHRLDADGQLLPQAADPRESMGAPAGR